VAMGFLGQKSKVRVTIGHGKLTSRMNYCQQQTEKSCSVMEIDYEYCSE